MVQLPANSPAAFLAGFDKLKAEKSVNYSIGFVAHPLPSLQITADAYQIRIKDRIVATGTLLGLNGTTVISQGVLDAIAAHGNILDPNVSYVGISVFTNGANTRTRGVEVTASYVSDFGEFGHVDWTAAFNYNETKVTKLNPLPAVVSAPASGQTVLLGPTALSLLTTATPKTKAVVGAFLTHGKWGVNLRETVYGKASEIVSLDGTGNGGIVEKIGVTAITDVDVGYSLTDSLRLNIGANNLFNKKAPTTPNVSDGAGGVRPGDGGNVYGAPLGFTPWGINGGYYYSRITYTF